MSIDTKPRGKSLMRKKIFKSMSPKITQLKQEKWQLHSKEKQKAKLTDENEHHQ